MKVPETLEECFAELKKLLSEEELEQFKGAKEDDLTDCQFGLGAWVRNNWGLWHDSALAQYFRGIGVGHPDDMSAIILTCFHHYLHGRDIKLSDQLKRYQNYYENRRNLLPGQGVIGREGCLGKVEDAGGRERQEKVKGSGKISLVSVCECREGISRPGKSRATEE